MTSKHNKTLRITHLFWSFTLGGAETMVSDIANLQVRNKDTEVSIIIINHHYDNNLFFNIDCKVSVFKLNRKPKSINPIFYFKLHRTLSILDPDIIHCHNYNLDKILKKKWQNRSILTVHGFYRALNPNNRFNKIVAISESVKQDLLGRGIRKVDVVMNGVFTNKIIVKKSFNQIPKICCIGRLEHQIKGQDILIKALYWLETNFDFRYEMFFIGDGSSKEYLMSLIKKYEIRNKVEFISGIPREELYNSIFEYDLLIQPSIIEGFGLTVVEAMSAKVPVIISEALGLLEETNVGKFGLVFANYYYKDLSIKILEILKEIEENRDSIELRLQKAWNYSNSKFNIINTEIAYRRLYNSISTDVS